MEEITTEVKGEQKYTGPAGIKMSTKKPGKPSQRGLFQVPGRISEHPFRARYCWPVLVCTNCSSREGEVDCCVK